MQHSVASRYSRGTYNGAPVAQLDRASGYEPEGREFDSLRARHFFSEKIKDFRDSLVSREPIFLHTLCTHARDGPCFEHESAKKIASGSRTGCNRFALR